MMKTKQSIVGTFYLHIIVVVLSSLIILLMLSAYRMVFDIAGRSFLDYMASVTTVELALIFLFGIVTTVIVGQLMARDLKQHFALFNAYFHDASRHLKKIDTKKLEFKEFEELALSVNMMVDDVKASKDEVLLHQSYLQAVLESQRNIVFVMADEQIISINKSFAQFFHVKSLDEFYNKYEKIV